jgi:hypothetical protein
MTTMTQATGRHLPGRVFLAVIERIVRRDCRTAHDEPAGGGDQKYPHVSYFFNCGIEKLIGRRSHSGSVIGALTYDLQPEMSAGDGRQPRQRRRGLEARHHHL